MSAASEDQLGLIHKQLTEWAIDLLSGNLTETTFDKEGNPHERVLRPSAAELAVIRAFLKDNDIRAVAGEDNAVARLKKKLEEQRQRRQGFDPARDLPVQ